MFWRSFWYATRPISIDFKKGQKNRNFSLKLDGLMEISIEMGHVIYQKFSFFMTNKMDEFYFHLDPREARSRYFTMLNLGLRVQPPGPSGLYLTWWNSWNGLFGDLGENKTHPFCSSWKKKIFGISHDPFWLISPSNHQVLKRNFHFFDFFWNQSKWVVSHIKMIART